MKPTVGLIGLGLMGGPMGQNLLRAGFPLVVWNRTKSKADELVREGAKLGADPACADGVCVLPDAELQALMSETLQRRDPSLRVVVSRI